MALRGLRILVTRPRHQAAMLIAQLEALGAEVIELPLIEIAPPDDLSALDAAIGRIELYDWIVFTSTNGVGALFGRLEQLGLDAPSKPSLAAIGSATRAALFSASGRCDFVPIRASAQGVLSEIGDVAGQRILLPRADIAREELAQGLRANGAIVDDVVAYRTIADRSSVERLPEILERGVHVATFFSPSAVRVYLDSPLQQGFAPVVVCVGPTTASAFSERGLRADVIAEDQTAGGVIEAMWRHFGAPA
jgi:uroporphyrinogen-III synthase